MSRSNATRCDWLPARCLAPRQQFWKTVRLAQHQAATPPCLSRGIRSTAMKMDEKLYIYFTLYLWHRRIYVTEEAFGCVQYFTDGVNEGSSITFCKKCACSNSKLSCYDKETSAQLQRASPHIVFYAAKFFIAHITGHVKCKYG